MNRTEKLGAKSAKIKTAKTEIIEAKKKEVRNAEDIIQRKRLKKGIEKTADPRLNISKEREAIHPTRERKVRPTMIRAHIQRSKVVD